MYSMGNILASLALVANVWAQSAYLATDLSFGHEARISPDLSSIPNFIHFGESSPPSILSNKIILTPPAPGNQRGAVWSTKTLQQTGWTADIDFRATGPERGGGKLTIWLARNGQYDVSTSSIYTVGKFDGLALTIDTYAGTAGMIRGFLNDGSTDYKSHHIVDSLAFGHCIYSYRNLGRPSRLKINQNNQNFQVSIDGNLCFESTKIRLPVGYNFGITAVSGETPDSFEVNRLVVTTETYSFNTQEQGQPSRDTDPGNIEGADWAPNFSDASSFEDPPEIDADKISVEKQFADLHNRLQAVMKHVSALHRDYTSGRKIEEQKLTAIHHMLSKQQYSSSSSSSSSASVELLRVIDKRLQDMETKFNDLASQIQHIKYAVADTGHIEDLKRTLNDTHTSLLSVAPKHGFLVFTILGSQAVLVVAYFVYKKRRANSPKKYL